MDRIEAAALLHRELASRARRPYDALVRLVGTSESFGVVGARGEAYQVELEIVWDARPGGPVRILGAIDDGRSPGSLSPFSDDVLVHPDGRVEGG